MTLLVILVILVILVAAYLVAGRYYEGGQN